MQRVSPKPNDSLIVICFSLRKVKAVGYSTGSLAGSHLSTKSSLSVKLKINKKQHRDARVLKRVHY